MTSIKLCLFHGCWSGYHSDLSYRGHWVHTGCHGWYVLISICRRPEKWCNLLISILLCQMPWYVINSDEAELLLRRVRLRLTDKPKRVSIFTVRSHQWEWKGVSDFHPLIKYILGSPWKVTRGQWVKDSHWSIWPWFPRSNILLLMFTSGWEGNTELEG